jgi:hypothetical protein
MLADKFVSLAARGEHWNPTAVQVNGSGMGYRTESSTTRTWMLDQEISIIDITVYDGLSLGAVKLLIRIQQELERNNPLWECTAPSPRERTALAQLKKANIIELIPGTDIYIVNPEKIRRGHPLVVLGALYKYCKDQYDRDKTWKITTAAIRVLTKKGAMLDEFTLIENG